MILILLVKFIAFPKRDDSIFQKQTQKENIQVSASGSLGFYYHGKCHMSYPNETLISNEENEWCSNIAETPDKMPWITYSLKNHRMRLTGYSLRNGCCPPMHHYCCCDETGEIIDSDGICCCRLYSFSLQGSNDNKTWKTIHSVEKKTDFYLCKYEIYEFPKTESFQFIRLILNQEFPGCPRCLTINEVDLLGETIPFTNSFEYDEENEESVSIIGKVKRY